MLVFCEKAKVSSEVYRVLKPDGIFGDNEATYVTPPPAQQRFLTSKLIGKNAGATRWGNIGDRKNDGFIRNKGIFYQVFAQKIFEKIILKLFVS